MYRCGQFWPLVVAQWEPVWCFPTVPFHHELCSDKVSSLKLFAWRDLDQTYEGGYQSLHRVKDYDVCIKHTRISISSPSEGSGWRSEFLCLHLTKDYSMITCMSLILFSMYFDTTLPSYVRKFRMFCVICMLLYFIKIIYIYIYIIYISFIKMINVVLQDVLSYDNSAGSPWFKHSLVYLYTFLYNWFWYVLFLPLERKLILVSIANWHDIDLHVCEHGVI